MTLKEVKMHADAYWWRRDEMGSLLAHFTAVLANPWYKGKITASKLYRRMDKPQVPLEERQKQFERAVKLMGADAIPVKRKVKNVG